MKRGAETPRTSVGILEVIRAVHLLWETFDRAQKVTTFVALLFMCVSQFFQLLIIALLAPLTALLLQGDSGGGAFANALYDLFVLTLTRVFGEGDLTKRLLFTFAVALGARGFVEILRNNAVCRLSYLQGGAWQKKLMQGFLMQDSSSPYRGKMQGNLISQIVIEPGHAANFLVRVLEYLSRLLAAVSILAGLWVADPYVLLLGLLISAPYLFLHHFFLKKKISMLGRERMEWQERQLEVSQENISSFRQIFLFRLESWRLETFSRVTSLYNQARIKFEIYKGIPAPMADILVAVAIFAFIFSFGDVAGIKDFLPRAVLMLFSGQQLLQAVANLSGNYMNLSFLVPSANQVSASVSAELGRASAAESTFRPASANIGAGARIFFSGVRMYNGAGNVSVALDKLEIPLEGVTVLKGPSGSGKSTILDLICGFREMDEGRGGVMVGGKEIPLGRGLNLGYVSQDCLLFEGSLRDNLRLQDSGLADEVLVKACLDAGLREFEAGRGIDLNHHIAEGGKNVSGGQRQRISIARVFARKYPFVMMDEPTSALDATSKNVLLSSIQEISRGIPLLVATHDEELISRADLVIDITSVARMQS